MRNSRTALLAMLLAAVGISGCAQCADVRNLCCRVCAAPLIESTLPPVMHGAIAPDTRGVGSPEDVDKLLGFPPAAGWSYYELAEGDCQCRAVMNSAEGNLLDADRESLRRKAGNHPSRGDAMKLDILRSMALEARNSSASQALQIYYGLYDGESRLELTRRSEQELLADMGRARQLHERGMQVPFDDSDFQRQLNTLRLSRIDLELLIAKGNHELRRRLGLTSLDRHVRIWPASEVKVVVGPVDSEAAVQQGLAMRPELRMLRRVAAELDHQTLKAARDMLSSISGLLGMKSDACLPHKLLVALHHKSEVDSRRQQVSQYSRQRDLQVAEGIREEVETIEARERQVALAKSTAENWQVRLHKLDALHTIGKASFPDIGVARLKSVEAQGEEIHAAVNWKIAIVKLKEQQGLLVAECCGTIPMGSTIVPETINPAAGAILQLPQPPAAMSPILPSAVPPVLPPGPLSADSTVRIVGVR